MRICDDLRQAVLQAAIQGKLTNQLPEDGDAADLLKKIEEKKTQLIKEGIIKKEKSLKSFLEDEIPFDIPDNWVWVHLGKVCINVQYGTSEKSSKVGKIPVLRMGNILDNGKIDYSDLVFTSDDNVIKKYPLDKGDLLFNRTNSREKVGKVGYYDGRIPSIYAGYLVRVTALDFESKYLNIVLHTNYYRMYCAGVRTDAIGQSNINAEKLKLFIIPLPPLAEQHRIVTKVEELMARIDDLEKTETELEKLKAAFPGDMKAALLQAAMQGKLTEQLPEDGDVADLINQIAKEKDQLIKEGKIKKEKSLPEITPDEVPFDIPENWKWVRFNDLINIYGGLAYKKGTLDIKSQQMVKVLRGGNILDIGYTFRTDDVEISSEFITNNELYLKKNQLITPAVTSLEKLGKVARIEKDYPDVVAGGFVLNLCPYLCNDILSTYLMYFFASPYLKQRCHDIAKKSGQAFYNLSRNKLLETAVAIPPLAEQKRIVEKLDKLLPLCDGLVEE